MSKISFSAIQDIIYIAPQPDWQFPIHSHETTVELSLVLAGKGEFYGMDRVWQVDADTLIVKNAGLAHAEKSDPDDPMEQICIGASLCDQNGDALLKMIPQHMYPVMKLPSAQTAIVRSVFQFLRDYGRVQGYEDAVQSAFRVVLELIQTHADSIAADQRQDMQKSEQDIRSVRQYLDEHYHEKIRIPELAERFFISEGHLSRRFKALTGYSVNQYLLSKRMGEAQRLLMFEDHEIKEIAAMCGYQDLQYFYHVFHRFAGCTPVAYRRKYRQFSKK